MRVLIDTNVLISLEDDKETEQVFAELVRLSSGKHELLVHPEATADIQQDRNERRAAITLAKLEKYKRLERPPVPDAGFVHQFAPTGRHNDIVDAHLLFAVRMNSVELLVSNDFELIRNARRAGLQDRVYQPREATRLLRSMEKPDPARHTAVESVPAHDLDLNDRFFDSFRQDYDGFDVWFAKISRSGRRCYVLRQERAINALMIYNAEVDPREEGVPPNVLKIATLKVADEVRGQKVGELFLKLAFQLAFNRGLRGVFVTVYPKYQPLIALLEDFGFEQVGTKRNAKQGDELVYLKALVPRAQVGDLGPVDIVRRYYPHFVGGARVRKYVVPIQPEYHNRLFPEVKGRQMRLADYGEVITEGNTIRKAYLSHSSISSIIPGALLLFYRSKDSRAITSIGVVERVERCTNAEQVMAQVGKRSVYSLEEVELLCNEGEVLVLLFWHVADLPRRVTYQQLRTLGVLRGPPQSIQEVTHSEFAIVQEVSELDKRSSLN